MKKNSMTTLLIGLLLLQPSLHANPFQTTAARIAAVGYWAFLSLPAISAIGGASQRPFLRQEITKLDENGNSILPDLKEYAPEKYAETKEILLREGLPNIDEYTIKVVTDASVEKVPMWKDIPDYSTPSSVGEKIILVHDMTCAKESSQYVRALSNLDSTSLAAILGHEMQHDIQQHSLQNRTLQAITPFILHGLTQLTPGLRFTTSPSITGSALRLAQGFAILMASELIGNYWYSRRCERDADAALKNSPTLARAMAKWLGRLTSDEEQYEKDRIAEWNSVRYENKTLGLTEITSTILAHTLNQADYVKVQKKHGILAENHPWPSERIAYLNKWADEADARKAY